MKPSLTITFALLVACGPSPRAEAPASAAKPTATVNTAVPLRKLERADFNRQALLSGLPLFWREDSNHNGVLDPDELAVYWAPVLGKAGLSDYVHNGVFTEAFPRALATISNRKSAPADAPKKETARLEAVEDELAQSVSTIVHTDLHDTPEPEKQMLALVLEAASLVEQVYARQRGTHEIKRFTDSISNALLFRNQTPLCLLSRDANCRTSLEPTSAKVRTEGEPALCASLKDDPFRVIVGTETLPFSVAYQAEMVAISERLAKAGAILQGGPETGLGDYLAGAARAFRDNTWFAADETWQLSSTSKYYLRIAPDERRVEPRDPCGTTWAFQLNFGVVSQTATRWQNKLEPLAIEKGIAVQIGAPYAARKVTLKSPAFVDMALRAGDSRYVYGTPIRQSIPRVGPSANEGRNKAVIATNAYQDADSRAYQQSLAESVFCADTIKLLGQSAEDAPLLSVLREAAINFGPRSETKGTTDGEPLASVLLVLQAQTTAMFLAGWLGERKELDRERVNRTLARALFWDLSHASRSAFHDEAPNDAQVAAVEFGALFKDKAITWNPSDLAANATDRGCYSIDIDKLPLAAKRLLRSVGGIRSRGDKLAGQALLAEFTVKSEHMARISERMQRAPKQSFVYSIRLE
jgi:hypothetical protein